MQLRLVLAAVTVALDLQRATIEPVERRGVGPVVRLQREERLAAEALFVGVEAVHILVRLQHLGDGAEVVERAAVRRAPSGSPSTGAGGWACGCGADWMRRRTCMSPPGHTSPRSAPRSARPRTPPAAAPPRRARHRAAESRRSALAVDADAVARRRLLIEAIEGVDVGVGRSPSRTCTPLRPASRML